ncbi:hypothetical protein NX059_000364 [Plenodomus lindquistii]|nr:hypothetical protein NX059_000364 [Plenodomus lindquistii]
MAPKRAAQDDVGPPAKKKKRAPSPERSSPERSSSESDSPPVNVRWVRPTSQKGRDELDTSAEVTQYAQLLFGRPWDELRFPRGEAFRFPHVRTPVYKTIGKPRTPDDELKLGQAFCNLFNSIQNQTSRQNGNFTRQHFFNAFAEEEGNAVIASEATENSILNLNTDYEVEVTVSPVGKEGETARLRFLRRSSPHDPEAENEAGDLGYFIELPHGMRVTVNGQTFINDEEADPAGDEGAATPFIIGPLTRYTVIELLAQPIFFFRATGDLDYFKNIEPKGRSKPDATEMSKRSTHGEVPIENVKIKITPVGGEVPDGAAKKADDAKDDADDKAKKDADDKARKDADDKANAKGKEDAKKGATEDGDTVYSDEWTDDDDSPGPYLQRHLLARQRKEFQTLVPRVLAAINARQEPAAGFSFYDEERVRRSGRTWLHVMAHPEDSDHFVLIIVGNKGLYVMDPLAWRSTPEARNNMYGRVLEALDITSWWQSLAYRSVEDMRAQLPQTLNWVPCPQTTGSSESLTLAVLAAWALALDLPLNVNFRPRGPAFFGLVNEVFQMALNDTLNWKVLTSFLRETGFVIAGEPTKDGSKSGHVDPEPDRRFDLSKRPFKDLVNAQKVLDDAEKMDKVVLLVELNGTGVPHTNTFASDGLSGEELRSLEPLINQSNGWDLQATWPELQERMAERFGSNAVDPPVSAPTSNHLDTSEIEADFQACQYLRSEMDRLDPDNYAPSPGWTDLPLSRKIFDSIASVVMGINELQPIGRGFSVHEEKVDNSVTSEDYDVVEPQDHIAIRYLHSRASYLLVIISYNSGARDKPTVHIVDYAPWESTPARRKQVYTEIQGLHGMGAVMPETIRWICGSGGLSGLSLFLTIVNAWAVLLNLPLNFPSFPNHSLSDELKVDVTRLYKISQHEPISWKLIWAFLRCYDLVAPDSQPPKDRRFTETVPPRLVPQHSARMRRRKRDAPDGADLPPLYRHFNALSSHGHGDDMPWDTNDEDRRVRIPALGPDYTPQLTRQEVRQMFDRLIDTPKLPSSDVNRLDTSELDLKSDPCEEFRSAMRQFTLDDRTNEKTATASMGLGGSLYQGIAAVAISINELRPVSKEFSVFNHNAERCATSAAKINRTTPHGQIIIRPVNLRNHCVLTIIQYTEGTDSPDVYVVDSAPWLSSLKDRQGLRMIIEREPQGKRPGIPDVMRWIYGAGRTDMHNSELLVTLTSWAILLDLRLNLTDFTPDAAFITDAEELLKLVQRGQASWKLIWDFLRCRNFVSSSQAPPPDRRFTRTVSGTAAMSEHGLHQTKMRQRPEPTPDALEHDPPYSHFNQDSGQSHNDQFPWDRDSEDTETRIPALGSAYTPQLTRDELHQLYIQEVGIKDPCAEFRERMNAILADERKVADLRDFRTETRPTQDIDGWLTDTEVSLAVGAVTLGITEYQKEVDKNFRGGFGFLRQSLVQDCEPWIFGPGEIAKGARTIRPGRPLLVPLHLNNHYILLVIQLDDNSRPTFSILNSMNYHLGHVDIRQHIHEWAQAIVKRHGWLSTDLLMPHRTVPIAHTMYMPSSQQPNQSECGYYVILNAWILALGLQPNPDARVDWNDQFFEDLLNVVHLARMGQADWALISAFLRCRDLVQAGGQVPADRRFSKTKDLRTEERGHVDDFLDDVRLEEDKNKVSGLLELSLADIRATNRCNLPMGVAHKLTFPYDSWLLHPEEMIQLAQNQRLLGLNLNIASREQLQAAQMRLMTKRWQDLTSQLQRQRDKSRSKTLDAKAILDSTRRYMTTWHAGRLRQHNARPSLISSDTLRFYQSMLARDILTTPFRSQRFPVFKNGRNELSSDEVNHAITSVLEAIDRRQSEQHAINGNDTVFAGGFSLVTDTSVISAYMGWGSASPFNASRPWRCLMIPLTVSDGVLNDVNTWRTRNKLEAQPGPGGHHLLAVIERSETEDGIIHMRYYDSCPRRLRDAYVYIAGRLGGVVRSLGWTSTRSGQTATKVTPRFHTTTVPEQLGGWACGAHTVINAWILALGLTPSQSVTYSRDIYEEFFTLANAACSGVLSWLVLASWLRHRNLVDRCNLDDIAEDRRFEFTRRWESVNELQDRIADIIDDEDTMLRTCSESDVPYDLSNNVGHEDEMAAAYATQLAAAGGSSGGAEVEVEEEEEEGKEEDDEEEEEDDEEDKSRAILDSLMRQYEDDGWDKTDHGEELEAVDTLGFLSGFKSDSAEDIDMIDADAFDPIHHRTRTEPDMLLFLDGFS